MKRLLTACTITVALMMSSLSSSAQYYFYNGDYYDNFWTFEIGGSVGAMNCLTDLGGKKGIGKAFFKDLNIGKTHFAGGAFFDIVYKNAACIRLEGTFGTISADDIVLKGVTDIAKERYNRNLNFRSTISEVSVMAELHPLFILIDWPAKDVSAPPYSPYLLVGIGYYSFNPQALLGKKWVDLQPLSTEGQGFDEYPDRPVYKLKQINYPVGLGVRYEATPYLNLRMEFVYRITNTDYLDDVSKRYIDPALFSKYLSGNKLSNALILNDRQIEQHAGPGGRRGSPTDNDAYFTANFKVALVLGRQRTH